MAGDEQGGAVERVLLVEDSAVQRAATGALLRKAGFEVSEAADGADALQQLESRDVLPDAILCDIGMPKMNGIAFCHAVKTTPSLQHLPVVLFTALGNDRNHSAAIEAGADDFLIKPVREDDLVMRMTAVMARSKLRSPGGPEWHHGVFDALPEAVAVTDAEHNYVDANPAALALLGYSRAELLHMNVLSDESQQPPWFTAGDAVWTGQARLRRADGAELPLQVHVHHASLGGGMFYVLLLRSVHS